MGLFDLLKQVTESVSDNVERTTTIRYAADAQTVETSAQNQPAAEVTGALRLVIADVFSLTGRGTVVTGEVEAGQVSVGDTVQLRRTDGSCRMVKVTGIEVFRNMLDTATEGMKVGVQLADIAKTDVGRGDVLER